MSYIWKIILLEKWIPGPKVRVILYLFPSSCVRCIFCATVSYSMVSIKHPILLNVLVWIFHKKPLLNDLIYLTFWEPQYMNLKKSRFFCKRLYQTASTISISNSRSIKRPGLIIESIEYLLLHPFQYQVTIFQWQNSVITIT